MGERKLPFRRRLLEEQLSFLEFSTSGTNGIGDCVEGLLVGNRNGEFGT